MDNSRIRLLLIGPLPPPIGGDTRHFLTLVEDMSASPHFHVNVIDVSRGKHARRWWANWSVAAWTLVRTASLLPRVDVVSMHASDRGMSSLGAAVVIMCRIMHRPSAVRLFGGSYGDCYETASKLKRWWIRKCVLSADAVLLQTKRLMRQLEHATAGQLVWFSTYLPPGSRVVSRDSALRSCRRFVFLGHLWRSKGVGLILDAARQMPPDTIVDMWGPLDEYSAQEVHELSEGRVVYRGVLTRDEVLPALSEYDCLLLPTQHPGEGYPGVIAEAFTAGIPVITTRWLAIPEIVDDSCGLLIEPGSVEQLRDAMNRMCRDPDLWRRLCAGATTQAELFSHARWSAVFERLMESLAVRSRSGHEARRD